MPAPASGRSGDSADRWPCARESTGAATLRRPCRPVAARAAGRKPRVHAGRPASVRRRPPGIVHPNRRATEDHGGRRGRACSSAGHSKAAMPPGHANLATDIAMRARKRGWLQPPAPVDAAIPQDRRTGGAILVNGQSVATMANMPAQTVIAGFRRHRREPRLDRTGQEGQGVDSVPDTRRLDLHGSEAAMAREGLPRLHDGCGLARSVHDIALSARPCNAWWAGLASGLMRLQHLPARDVGDEGSKYRYESVIPQCRTGEFGTEGEHSVRGFARKDGGIARVADAPTPTGAGSAVRCRCLRCRQSIDPASRRSPCRRCADS